MSKLLKLLCVLCIAGIAMSVSPAFAAETTYLKCVTNVDSGLASVRTIALDEAAKTVTIQYREPRPATFTTDRVAWDAGGPNEINRSDLSFTSSWLGSSNSGYCTKIPPFEINPKQKWTMRALSLNCSSSGRDEGNLPVIQLKGQMRLDLKYRGRERSRIVFHVTSKKGYRKITCDGRNHTSTDATKYVFEGKGQELLTAQYRIRTNFDEVDFGSPIRALRTYAQGGLAQALWPDKIFQGSSSWSKIPEPNDLRGKKRLVRQYSVPRDRGEPNLYLRVEFERVE